MSAVPIALVLCADVLGQTCSPCPVSQSAVIRHLALIDGDPGLQREIAINALATETCELRLCALWMNMASSDVLTVAVSCDGGHHWYVPGTPSDPCPTPDPSEHSLLSDLLTACCPLPATPCNTCPFDCDDETRMPRNWSASEPGVGAGGNGTFYLFGSRADRNAGVISRIGLDGQFVPFVDGMLMKQICPAIEGGLDKAFTAADPAPGSQKVFFYWSNRNVQLVYSLDAAETLQFAPGSTPDADAIMNFLACLAEFWQ